MTTNKPMIIEPLKFRCNCGNKVTDHHFLCNKCYSKKMKRQNKFKSKKRKGKFNPPKWMNGN